jgi:hypothetical protein
MLCKYFLEKRRLAVMPFFTFYRLQLKECSPQEFLRPWAALYREGPVKDDILRQNLNPGEKLENLHLEPLLRWRRQQSLEEKDLNLVKQLGQALTTINAFRMKPKTSEEETLDFYDQVAAWVPDELVLRVFILHLTRPHQFPLFDENIYLAHRVISELPPVKPKPLDPDNDAAYFSFMKTFFQMTAAGVKPEETLYRALSAFGHFLRLYQSVIQF